MPQNVTGSDSRHVENGKREISQSGIEKALNPDFANIGFSGGNSGIANIGTPPSDGGKPDEQEAIANIGLPPSEGGNDQEDDELGKAQEQGEGRRIEVLGRGKYWQWRWSRKRGDSRYAGSFESLPEARKRQYANRKKKARANKR